MTETLSHRLKWILVGGIIILGLAQSAIFSQWLNPAPSDIRLSFEATSPVENSRLPQEALDNHMPQLGKFPFWIDGKLMQAFGPYSPYVMRYLLFFVSLALLLSLFLSHIKQTVDEYVYWVALFFLTVTGTFFWGIKFFFWLDYLVVIPLSLMMIIAIKKNLPWWSVFILVTLILYVKLSAVFIIATMSGIFLTPTELKKYLPAIAAALVIMAGTFLLKWGFKPLSDRGHSFILNFSGYFLMALNLITRPWLIFSFYDKAHQRIVTDIDLLLVIKSALYLYLSTWMFIKKIPHLLFRILCILSAFICSLALLRDQPSLHDFAAYIGIVELGFIGLIWAAYKYSNGKQRKTIMVVLLVFLPIQLFLWHRNFHELHVDQSKISLIKKLEKLTTAKKASLFLFCSWNVGEFEYYLNDVTIRYSLWNAPFRYEELNRNKPSLLLIPQSCLHEKVDPVMSEKYASVIRTSGASHLETIQIDKNQIYELYEVR